MIQAREIKLGNIIQGGAIDLLEVRLLDGEPHIDCIRVKGNYVPNPQPEPLTEEWLIKMGFSHSEYKDGYIGIDVGNTNFVLCEPENSIESENTYADKYRFQYTSGRIPLLRTFDYVHDLQNFFFALTGTDLQPIVNEEKLN